MLSGGQQQRVALARSAAARPQVMLLDEPLSNLDAKLREHMRIELRRLINELGMTAIYITHDQSEAMALADKVIFMKDGKIEQQGTPREIYNRPATQAVAQFIGSATFLRGTLSPGENGLVVVDIGSGFRLQAKVTDGAVTGKTTAAVRPERVRLASVPSGAPFEIEGSVAQVVFLGDYTEYAIDIGSARVTARSQLVLDVGARVFVSVKPDDVILLPASDDAGSK
jgi:iron(III) transport system ATP-binding protein